MSTDVLFDASHVDDAFTESSRLVGVAVLEMKVARVRTLLVVAEVRNLKCCSCNLFAELVLASLVSRHPCDELMELHLLVGTGLCCVVDV